MRLRKMENRTIVAIFKKNVILILCRARALKESHVCLMTIKQRLIKLKKILFDRFTKSFSE